MRGERLFRLLLHLYPRPFRDRYRDDLIAFFHQERARGEYTGPLGASRFWVATIRDLAAAAFRERRQRRQSREADGARSAGLTGQVAFDVRYAVRSLVSTPALSLTALAVLSLGIGASTAIFAVVDNVVLRGLPYHDSDRLVAVQETDIGGGVAAQQRASLGLPAGRPISAAYQNYVDWAARQDVFDGLAASATGPAMTTADAERPEQLRTHRITANLLDILGTPPRLGPGITADDEGLGAKVAIISDGLWRRRFNADPGVIGRSLAVEQGTYTIVGVMGPEFLYPVGPAIVSQVDLWTLLTPGPRDLDRSGGRNYFTRVVGRLAPGVTLEQASARMTQIRDALALEHPRWFDDHGIVVRPLKTTIVAATSRSWMLMLLAAVAVVFLVACANVANLMLARASGRTREIGVRAAMGATRGQIVRALLVESVVLTAAGAALGVVLAYWGVEVLRATLPTSLPRVWLIAVDLRIVAITAGVAVCTGVLCGLVPALQMSRTDVAAALRSRERSASAGRSASRWRQVFLVTEVALAAALLVGAGIFATSFIRLVNTDLGFEATDVLSVSVRPKLPDDDALLDQAVARGRDQMAQILARVVSLPGVRSAALVAGGVPLSGSWNSQPVRRGETEWTGRDEAIVKEVTSAYLDTIGARLLAGRGLASTDTSGAPPVVVLNDEAARRYFGGRDPLGAQVSLDGQPPRTVVGIVRGMRLTGPEAEIRPEAYVPYAQASRPSISASLVVATDRAAETVVPAVREVVWELAPGAVVPEPTTFAQMFGTLIAQRKLNTILLSLFGALALLIAMIGVYGVLAYVVEGRRKEIGVRMALGADPVQILRMVLSQAVVTVGAGLVLGLLAAVWSERLIMAFVYRGVERDPAVYAAAAVVLMTLGLLAAYVPARRAARVDPLIALRAE